MTDENKAARDALIASLGLTISAAFIPQQVSRNAESKDPSLNWSVTIRAENGASLTTDYMQGIGHVPGYEKTRGRNLMATEQRAALEDAAKTGKYPRRFMANTSRPVDFSALPQPTLDDVLYSLVNDAEAADMVFEDWCNTYGCDTDSRKAEATYRACVDTGIRLRRVVGGAANLHELSNLFSGF